MTPWLDGLTVLVNEGRLTAAILLAVIAGQGLVSFLLRVLFGERLIPAERLALSLTGWTFPLLFLSLLWYFTGLDWLFWILPAVPILFLLSRLRTDLKPALPLTSLFLLLFFFLTLPLRLAYLSQTDLPLYFDSAQHYLIIKTLLLKNQSLLWGWLGASYYHFGFHFLAAFIANAAGAEIARVMLILGQIILLLLPFSVFFLVRQQTDSDMAGGFALLLAAFGWYMPAHAVNWGKYPALMSLGLIPFVLSLASLIHRHAGGFSSARRRLAYGMLGASILLTILTHSRSAVVLGIILLAWAGVTRLEKDAPRAAPPVFFFVVAATILQAAFLLKQDVLKPLFDPYLFKSAAVTAMVLLLAVFAWKAYPHLTFISVLTVAAMLGGMLLPVTILPPYPNLTLLDRPYVEMALWLPLSLLGGLGLAGVQKALKRRWLWNAAVLLAGAVIVVNASFTHRLYPSECCVLVGRDDAAAIAWLDANLPLDATVGIASSLLRLTSADVAEGEAGADAGIWITPLTGRTTVLLSNASAFDKESTLKEICKLRVGYLFVGERGQPFHSAALLLRPAWYKPLLLMPRTGVYEVIGCD
jgi:hypothetical protein